MIDILAATPDAVVTLAQAVPGSGAGMEAPPGMESIMDRIISAARWIGIAVTVIAVIVAAGGAAISRNRGTSEEATERFLTISIAVAVISSAVTIISWILEASGGNG